MSLFCDIFVLVLFIVYILYFYINSNRYGKLPKTNNKTVDNAYFLRKDWLKGALLFKGWHHVFQFGTILFPIMTLFYLVYDSASGRPAICTCLSLIFTIISLCLKFGMASIKYRKAYISINETLNKYEGGIATEEDLIESINKGEEIIQEQEDYS